MVIFNSLMTNLSTSSPQYHSDQSVLIYPIKWLFTSPVPSTYITYSFSFKLLITYLLRVGFYNVFLKVLSRFSENRRNSKIYGVGLGLVFNQANSESVDTCLFYTPSTNLDSYLYSHISHVLPLGFRKPIHHIKYPLNSHLDVLASSTSLVFFFWFLLRLVLLIFIFAFYSF